jgi:hypothetical protein
MRTERQLLAFSLSVRAKPAQGGRASRVLLNGSRYSSVS